ncbi:hypothetical protein PS850_05804 [Pseudomonas fluorescens]|nr:hypothetical protein PS850_05804 [Pseudomonas fluorescens]
MDVNDDAYFLEKRVACTFIASKLAPTGGGGKKNGDPQGSLFFIPREG